jgi:CRP-like cAMP-binding protein
MSQPSPPPRSPELTALAAVVRRNRSGDSRRLTRANWHTLSKFMLRRTAEPRTCLIQQGENERGVYFVESGLLRVFRSEARDKVQMGVIGAGSLVGEGAFFAPLVRNASVEAIEPSVLWELSTEAFAAMAAPSPNTPWRSPSTSEPCFPSACSRPGGRLSVT